MKKQVYHVCLAIVIAVMILALGLGLTSGNPVLPVIAIVGGIGVVYFCYRRVSEVMDDDLSAAISGKAALMAFEITIILAAVVFAGAMTFAFNGGYGGGFHMFGNGSVSVSFMQGSPLSPGWITYQDTYLISDPTAMTSEDFWGLDHLFAKGHQERDFPFAFGAAMGTMVILLAGLYIVFSIYYNRKFGT